MQAWDLLPWETRGTGDRRVTLQNLTSWFAFTGNEYQCNNMSRSGRVGV